MKGKSYHQSGGQSKIIEKMFVFTNENGIILLKYWF